MKTKFNLPTDSGIDADDLQCGDWAQIVGGDFDGLILFVTNIDATLRLINMSNGAWYDDLPTEESLTVRKFTGVTITLGGMMTKEEYLIVAECAENYPPGRGFSFFSHVDVTSYFALDDEDLADPASLAFG